MDENSYQQSSGGYGKRPWWHWLVLYIVIGAIAYVAMYYLFFYNRGGYSYNSQTQTQNTNTNQTSNKNYMIQNMNVEVLKEGSGAEAKTGDMVTVNYTGTLTDGAKFDSSLNPGRTPFQFKLGENLVIQGWELGVLGMKIGEKRKLTIPPELAYGANGRPPVIPQKATLLFDVELLKIN